MQLKDKEYYLNLPYNFVVKKVLNENGVSYIGKVLELENCICEDLTVEGVSKKIFKVFETYIESQLDEGLQIPEPVGDENYSGKFNVRLPKSLHRQLIIEAKEEGVSLNQYVLYKLSR